MTITNSTIDPDSKSKEPLSPQLIAFYLPQFHPIPENDAWWGKGFTEWINVVRGRPKFPGHYQPHLPADLGFYDLRTRDTREAQAQMARQYGVHGFCYYHYWFNGKRLLERPFNEVLTSGEPDFPFCLCWANENWSRTWDGSDKQILVEQNYNEKDDVEHIQSLLPSFADPRYIRIGGRPLFLVYGASRLPNPAATAERWRTEVARAGLGEIFLCRVESFHEFPLTDPRQIGFDASVGFEPAVWRNTSATFNDQHRFWSTPKLLQQKIRRISQGDRSALPYRLRQRLKFEHRVVDYDTVVDSALAEPDPLYPRFPCVCPSWDNTARRKNNALIIRDSTPEKYNQWLLKTLKQAVVQQTDFTETPVVFINAWNEWAEGNHLEPDQRWGHKYLEATRDALGQIHSTGVTE